MDLLTGYNKTKTAVFISGKGSNLKSLIKFSKSKEQIWQEVFSKKVTLNKQGSKTISCVNFFPKKNDLLIFDARLLHQIGPHLTTNPRICLAFEIFAKGAFVGKIEGSICRPSKRTTVTKP